MREGYLLDLGQKGYVESNQLQLLIKELISKNKLIDTVILVEHYPVFTVGRSGGYEYFKVSLEYLSAHGIDVVEVDRGGSVTFHGLGQLVVYPIVRSSIVRDDLLVYLRLLESVIINTLDVYSIRANRFSPYTGVWVDNEKIAAIGVSCKKGIFTHGLALNINIDISYFSMIDPCGIKQYSVTTMAKQLGYEPKINDVKEIMASQLAKSLELSFSELSLLDILQVKNK